MPLNQPLNMEDLLKSRDPLKHKDLTLEIILPEGSHLLEIHMKTENDVFLPARFLDFSDANIPHYYKRPLSLKLVLAGQES